MSVCWKPAKDYTCEGSFGFLQNLSQLSTIIVPILKITLNSYAESHGNFVQEARLEPRHLIPNMFLTFCNTVATPNPNNCR